jgi:uncharacterized protein
MPLHELSGLGSPPPRLAQAERRALTEVALASIRHGLAAGQPLPIDLPAYPPSLREARAVFVTLRRAGRLRGCVGELEAVRPLVESTARHAYAAAFRDPRFRPLGSEELADLAIHLSVLGPPEPLDVASEAELLAILRPGVDGLLIEDGPHRATFLPAVWESLPEPAHFLRELKQKAGLPAGHWSAGTRAWRYVVESV